MWGCPSFLVYQFFWMYYISIFQSKSWTKTSVCWGGAFKPGVLCLTPTCGNASNLRKISFQLSCNSSPSSAEVQLEMINPTRYFWQISSEVEVLGVDHFWYVYNDIHLDIYIYALSSHTWAYSSLLTCDCFTIFFFWGGGDKQNGVFNCAAMFTWTVW